jgi:hypothetical protein
MTDRAQVVGNKIIYAKLKIKENRWMRNRLLSVKSTVDNKTPHSFLPGGPFTRKDGTRRVNLKKKQLKEDRRRLIAQDNAIMLKSISNIMRHNNIDTWAKTRKYVPGMSNIGGRKKKLNYIKWENKLLLRRINTSTPWISNEEIRKSYNRQLKHLKHMGEYAYRGGGKKHGSFDKYWQVAVYEARPIRGKGSNFRRPNTSKTVSGQIKEKFRPRTSQSMKSFRQSSKRRGGNGTIPIQNRGAYSSTGKLIDRPGTSTSMQYRPGTSGSMGMASDYNRSDASRPQSRARTPTQIPISTWDREQSGQNGILTASIVKENMINTEDDDKGGEVVVEKPKKKVFKLEPIKDLPPLPKHHNDLI